MSILNSLLKNKYKTVIKLIIEMMSAMKSMRPTCEQLINNKSLWALNMIDIQSHSILEKLRKLSISEFSIENNFSNYFLKRKSMHI